MDSGFKAYLITDRHCVKDGELLEKVEEGLRGGIRLVQLREKDLSARELMALAHKMRELTGKYEAKLIINDRADIALITGADGVHLGNSSFDAKDARELLGAERLIGVSTHNMREALKAEADGADFITFGPVYYTPSKASFGDPVGVGALKEVCAKIKLPVFALGGVSKENIEEVLGAGAYGAAFISTVLGSPDAEKSAREISAILEGC